MCILLLCRLLMESPSGELGVATLDTALPYLTCFYVNGQKIEFDPQGIRELDWDRIVDPWALRALEDALIGTNELIIIRAMVKQWKNSGFITVDESPCSTWRPEQKHWIWAALLRSYFCTRYYKMTNTMDSASTHSHVATRSTLTA